MPKPDRIIRTARKTIAIYVSGDGEVEVRAPRRATNAQIRAFLDAKAAWIAEKQAFLRSRAPRPHAFRSGERFEYLGENYPLEIVPHNSPALAFDGQSFRLALSAQPQARDAFIQWYQEQARTLLSVRVPELASLHHIGYTKIRFSSARTRWGSCSASGTLSFSWRLIMAPPESIDYVIIHELAHVLHKNHAKQFWAQVAAMQPDYARRASWLKENGRRVASL